MKINTVEDIEKISGQTVTLQGIYVESKLAQKPAKGVHTGRYSLKISETLEVLLLPPYMPASVRPTEEADRFKGKRVQIKGIVEPRTYMDKPTLEYQPQSVSIPCFVEVSDIKLVQEGP
ncbi:hypothetical protein FNH22_10085 [Fulvivirga sp. M361]|uniref:hypothetical protein n=1 Tax=Fulvivirga sp. M361 TaxID=2594266 RepID=UPI00117AB75A|nr:hypothetical protein [Fulvivirga sp. M361]TRX59498.1 hypothetical protein FNH22_10085 [Fulvivirga sp. M361]